MYLLIERPIFKTMGKDERERIRTHNAAVPAILKNAGYGLLKENDPCDLQIDQEVSGVILQQGWHRVPFFYGLVQRCASLDKTFYWYEEGATSLVRISNENMRKALAVGCNTAAEYIDKLLK